MLRSDYPGRVYRESLAATLGAALGAGMVLVVVDLLITRGRAGHGGAGLLLLTMGLYALPCLLAGLASGIVAGAVRATHGPGAVLRGLRALREDRALDARATGALLAGVFVALLVVLACSQAALMLVADVQRQSTGALLAGLVVVALIPVLATLGWPAYRLTRHIGRYVPPLGPLPSVLSAVILGFAAVLLLAVYFIFTQLEWRALNLTSYALGAAYPVLMLAWLVVWYGPLAHVRERLPARSALVGGASLIALLLPLVALRGQPSPANAVLLSEFSPGARVLVGVGRALIDRDGDGHSPFLGGPDCDDSNPDVHPDAAEIPDNGVDDNCIGGDRTSPPLATHTARSGVTQATTAGSVDAGQVTATSPAPTRRADNLLFILLDTVRADRLGVAGYQRDGKSLTPRIDELARTSSHFTRVYAQAPNTPRSVPPMFTSRYPSQVKVHKKFHNFPKVLDENLSMFEVLQDAGIHTVGYASHFYFEERRNIHQGFDHFDNAGALDIKGSNTDVAAPRIVPRVEAKLAELGENPRRFAMFVHLFEPHSTYIAHPEYPITERGTKGLEQKYDYEIAYSDQWIGKLLDALDRSGLADTTMVVLASDHGEAFGVHRVGGKKMFFHGQTLYDELLRVPLLIRVPGVAPGTYDDVSMLLDVAPTLVDAMGLPVPDAFVGRSLVGRMTGEALAPRPAYGELLPAPSWNHAARMVVSSDGKTKLIHRSSDNRFELYDLAADPQERTDLSRSHPDLLAALKEELTRWIEVDLP